MFYISNVQKNYKHWFFDIFTKKTRAEILRILVCRMPRDLSYETHLGPKTKTVSSATVGPGAQGAEPPDENKFSNPICG